MNKEVRHSVMASVREKSMWSREFLGRCDQRAAVCLGLISSWEVTVLGRAPSEDTLQTDQTCMEFLLLGAINQKEL